VIYVLALDHYCKVLYEDHTKNAMHEAWEVWKSLVHAKYFSSTAFILFLNRDDRFRDALKKGISLAICFSRENHWEGKDTWDKDEVDQERFDDEYEEALHFIQQVFEDEVEGMSAAGKHLYTHVTTATDRDNIRTVFHDVQHTVVRHNLAKGGFLS